MKIKLAHLISAINNGVLSKSFSVDVPYSSLNYEVLDLLLKQNLIVGFTFFGTKFTVVLKYLRGTGAIRKLHLISKLKRQLFMTKPVLQNKTRSGNVSGFFVISTPNGLVTHFESLNLNDNFGGEVILHVLL
ncbi:MAG: 30S ribosomal protein S8 [Burkholderiaceae bacterium]|nr:30S ribosomal protein S8 [Burkholderiaceae bacterium]